LLLLPGFLQLLLQLAEFGFEFAAALANLARLLLRHPPDAWSSSVSVSVSRLTCCSTSACADCNSCDAASSLACSA